MSDKKKRSTSGIIFKWLVILFVAYAGFQFLEGVYDSHSGRHSLLTMGLKIQRKNSYAAELYRWGIHTNPEVQQRIDDLNSTLEDF